MEILFSFSRKKVYIPTKEFIDLSIFCDPMKKNGIKGDIKILK